MEMGHAIEQTARGITMRSSGRQSGITLIELMIVVVVVGILASIAYPGYQEYVRRAKRAEAKGLLSDVAGRMERYYFDHNTYSSDLTDLGYASATPPSAEGHYTASVAAGPSGDIATSYLVTATPDSSVFNDPKCGALTLDSRGTKGSSSGNVEDCWR
jgi:type IV pilus assembly protein PilE